MINANHFFGQVIFSSTIITLVMMILWIAEDDDHDDEDDEDDGGEGVGVGDIVLPQDLVPLFYCSPDTRRGKEGKEMIIVPIIMIIIILVMIMIMITGQIVSASLKTRLRLRFTPCQILELL